MSTASRGDPAPPRRTALVAGLSAPMGFGAAVRRPRHPDAIRLLSGIPDPGALPTRELADAAARVLAEPGVPALQYSRNEGIPLLREWIAAREGLPAERIVITNGGFHGLALALQSVVEPGELVAVDDPIFPLFLRSLELVTGTTLPVRVGPHGLDVDRLADLLRGGARPVAAYTVPDFHNPSQGTLPTEARAELVRLAEHHGFVVLADNPYRELRFRGEPQGTGPFNDSSHVIHVNTFTKTLGPGLRLGWLVLPEPLVPDVVALHARYDLHTSTFVQAVVAELLTADPPRFDSVLERARATYRERAVALAAALEREAPGAFEVDPPEGGLFLWPRIADDRVDPDRLADDASAEGVDYARGSYFASGPGTDADRRLRLAYGDVPVARLEEAAARIGRALRRQVG